MCCERAGAVAPTDSPGFLPAIRHPLDGTGLWWCNFCSRMRFRISCRSCTSSILTLPWSSCPRSNSKPSCRSRWEVTLSRAYRPSWRETEEDTSSRSAVSLALATPLAARVQRPTAPIPSRCEKPQERHCTFAPQRDKGPACGVVESLSDTSCFGRCFVIGRTRQNMEPFNENG